LFIKWQHAQDLRLLFAAVAARYVAALLASLSISETNAAREPRRCISIRRMSYQAGVQSLSLVSSSVTAVKRA
jgi:hypothetical protein